MKYIYQFMLIALLGGHIMAANKELVMELANGDVVIELRDDIAPNHVSRISELVDKGFYDNLVFHRVIENFMAQTGDPSGNGTGGSGQNINAEFSDSKHVRGTVSMARAQDPNSADSQFFICFQDTPWLDGQYTVWGQVISGMDFIDQVKKGHPHSGTVEKPDKIVKMYLREKAHS